MEKRDQAEKTKADSYPLGVREKKQMKTQRETEWKPGINYKTAP